MGQFIDTQQGLLTEAKQKRLERERKQAQKERMERLEMQLYNILIGYFTEEDLTPKDYYKKYVELAQIDAAKKIIGELTRREAEEYYLNKKYNGILKNIYNNFKIQNDYIIKEEKEAKKQQFSYYDILNNGEELEPKPEPKNYNFLIYLIGIPIHFIICLFYFATKPRKRKRR